jgi:hypothetical protein
MTSAAFDPSAAFTPDSGIFGLPHGPDEARVVLLPVPFDATASYRKGAARGPAAILSASRQIDLARRLGQNLGISSRRNTGPRWRMPAKETVFIAIGAAGTVLIAASWLRRRLSRRKGGSKKAQHKHARAPIVRLYQTTLARLSAQGWSRQPDETPREFAARLQKARLPGADAMTLLTEHYGAVRYGDRDLPPEVVVDLGQAISKLDGRDIQPVDRAN